MGRSVDIDLHFDGSVTVTDFVAALARDGVDVSYDGVVNYHLTDDFDWISGRLDEREIILAELARSQALGNIVGVSISWIGTEFGANLMFPTDVPTVSVLLSADRKILDKTFITDFSWYLNKIVPLVQDMGLTGVECHDTKP